MAIWPGSFYKWSVRRRSARERRRDCIERLRPERLMQAIPRATPALLAGFALLSVAAGGWQSPSPQAEGSPPAAASAAAAADQGLVQTEIRNVNLHLSDGIQLSIHALRGALIPTKAGRPPVFDDKESFRVRIDSGEIAIGTASLTALMNEHVLSYRKAPLKDVEVGVDEGRLTQKGKLHKGIDIPFKTKGTVDVTPDGRIRIHARSIKAAGLPVKGLMGVFGLEMDDMVKMEAERGIVIEENDILLDPQRLLPAPGIEGRVASVRIVGDELVQVFGTIKPGEPRLQPPARGRNFMYFRGNLLRFGKLTMKDTDLEIIDKDPGDPFDFYLDHYNEQLVAGYSKNTPQYGLKTYFPDYADLPAGARAKPQAATGGRP